MGAICGRCSWWARVADRDLGLVSECVLIFLGHFSPLLSPNPPRFPNSDSRFSILVLPVPLDLFIASQSQAFTQGLELTLFLFPRRPSCRRQFPSMSGPYSVLRTPHIYIHAHASSSSGAHARSAPRRCPVLRSRRPHAHCIPGHAPSLSISHCSVPPPPRAARAHIVPSSSPNWHHLRPLPNPDLALQTQWKTSVFLELHSTIMSELRGDARLF
jgi:hypothetical protein